jgi:hypothetical protein
MSAYRGMQLGRKLFGRLKEKNNIEMDLMEM